jgi:hypothetical protein
MLLSLVYQVIPIIKPKLFVAAFATAHGILLLYDDHSMGSVAQDGCVTIKPLEPCLLVCQSIASTALFYSFNIPSTLLLI